MILFGRASLCACREEGQGGGGGGMERECVIGERKSELALTQEERRGGLEGSG